MDKQLLSNEITVSADAHQSGVLDERLKAEIDSIPDRLAFKIGDVAEMIGVKTYVLRFWETEFEFLRPKKSKHNQRVYTKKDVENILIIKKLLYRDRFSIEGARGVFRSIKKQIKVDLEERLVSSHPISFRAQLQDLLQNISELKNQYR